MSDRKPMAGPESEILLRLRKLTEDVHRLRREFQAAIRSPKRRGDTAAASDMSKPRKKRR